VLELRDLLVTYGAVRALDRVSFHVEPGSITAVLGANGAGKTTLLRTISGLRGPRGGSVLVNGRDITGLRAEEITRLGVAHVPEGGGTIPELTVAENLRLGTLAAARRGRERRGRGSRDAAGHVYELFPALWARRRLPAATLSGGERQMLALGRALMSDPRLLLVDEPSLGLAPRIAAQIMAVLRNERDHSGRTVILVEQNARSALSVADRAVVLNLGAVAAEGDAAQVAADDRLRHAYLGF
jgi:branched-chain amino acid transport system ATP-binding protein